MAETTGFEFEFDTKKAERNALRMADSIDHLSSFGMAKAVALGSVLASAITKAAGFLQSKFATAMPFVSQTFDQLSTVFFNNLFYPLSRELMPILMRLSNWVAENRINFVKLGTVIVSIFKAAWTILSSFFQIIKNLATSMFEGILGTGTMTFDRLMNLFNLVLLKIVFVIMFVTQMIEPLLNGIGNILKAIMKTAVLPFFEGFGEGFSEYIEPLEKSFTEMRDALFEVTGGAEEFFEALSFLKPVFKFLGWVLGTIIAASLKAVINLIKTLFNIVKSLFGFGTKAIEFGKAIYNGIGDAINWIVEKFQSAWQTIKDAFGAAWDWVKEKFNSLFDGTALNKLMSLFGLVGGAGGSFGGAGANGHFKMNTSVGSPNVAGGTPRAGGSRNSTYNGGAVTINVDGGNPQMVRQAVTQAMSRSSYAEQFYKESQAKGLK